MKRALILTALVAALLTLPGLMRRSHAATLADAAERFVGYHEGQARTNRLVGVNTRRVPWCQAFVKAMFMVGHRQPPSLSLAVRGWDTAGVGPIVNRPRRGDIAFWRHPHAGIVVSVKGAMVCTVSGNRSNAVKRSCEPLRRFRHFRRVR
jgi:hypothetical protein